MRRCDTDALLPGKWGRTVEIWGRTECSGFFVYGKKLYLCIR